MAYVLVVDDDKDVRGVIRSVLEQAGHEVTPARDGLEALNLIGTRDFAVALVDLYMEKIDGLELIPKLRLQSPETRIIAMSGGFRDGKGLSLLSVAERLGAVRTLTKPFGIDDLTSLVEEVLASDPPS